MTATRRRRLQRATAVVPLALVSAAWTASLVGPGTTTVASTEQGGDTTASAPANLPDGSSVPSEAIEAPASISRPSTLGAGVKGRRQQIVRTASTNAIPSAALAAYQRAETVINAADESCKIPWQLIAAIGRVESDHGRANGNTLDDDGLARPGIYGIALNGSNKTSAIRDTDAGQYDNDRRWDRAVGPMQFIPSTWAVVGVDADGDGQRDPQDVDDAALATAVYLCSGDDDLSELPGQRASIFRYNHSKAYVDLVISVMNAYLNGDYTSVPTKTASAGGPIAPDPLAPSPGSGGSSAGGAGGSDGAGGAGGSSSSGSSSGSSSTGDTTAPPPDDGGSTPAPTDPPDSSGDGGVVGDVGGAVDDVVDGATSNLPGSGGGSGGSGGGSGGSGGGSGGSGGGSGGSGGGSGGGSEGGSTMSKAEATAKCLADNPLLSGAALAECVSKLMG